MTTLEQIKISLHTLLEIYSVVSFFSFPFLLFFIRLHRRLAREALQKFQEARKT